MANLNTSFTGIPLRSPVVAGASSLSKKIDNIKAAEDAGAGALVIYSLFQEQVELDAQEPDEALAIGSDHFAESLTYSPHLEHAGPREHIMWVEKARKTVSFPLFGSVNATSIGNWVEYAKQLESAGCNGLELNLLVPFVEEFVVAVAPVAGDYAAFGKGREPGGVNIVDFAVGDDRECRNVTVVVEDHVQLDGSLGLPKLGPRK